MQKKKKKTLKPLTFFIPAVTYIHPPTHPPQGTLLALASSLGYVDEEGNFPKSKMAFASDALATMFGSLFGLSPVTSYIESGSGVEAGSKTGLTAVICGFYFFLSIFFAPIISSIPPWATGGALVIVGALMCRSLGEIKWWDITHALTAFLTVIIMPLTYSIAYGLIAGIGCYFIMSATFKLFSLVGIPYPDFEPPETEEVVEKEVSEDDLAKEDDPTGMKEAEEMDDPIPEEAAVDEENEYKV